MCCPANRLHEQPPGTEDPGHRAFRADTRNPVSHVARRTRIRSTLPMKPALLSQVPYSPRPGRSREMTLRCPRNSRAVPLLSQVRCGRSRGLGWREVQTRTVIGYGIRGMLMTEDVVAHVSDFISGCG